MALAERIATPIDDGVPARAYVGFDVSGWRPYFALEGGRRQQWVDAILPPTREGGRLARQLAELLNARLT